MKRHILTMVVLAGLLVGWPSRLLATNSDPTSSSSNYSVTESTFGQGLDLQSGSTSYSLDGGTLGDTAIGSSTSGGAYQSGAGFNTTADPSLAFVVGTALVDLGALSQTSASTATATFRASNYTSYGYAITIIGAPPTNSGHQLTPLSADTVSQNGVEQFGVNTVANTSPTSVGANPVQVPGSSFSYGRAGLGAGTPYAQTGKYRFVSGETIASAPKTSGETDYTLSFMANISPTTPGGAYSGALTLVCTGTY